MSFPDSSAVTIDWAAYEGVLFDLDGVVTPTAQVHERAWAAMFDDYLLPRGLDPFTAEDYHRYVDGKPRIIGTSDFLRSRGVLADEEELTRLSNAKNERFTAILGSQGVDPYPGTVALLDLLDGLGKPVGLVSSSANARHVLAAAGLEDRFDVVVDGVVAKQHELLGKPSPATFLYAAALLEIAPERTAVAEDAISGVQAAASGGFGLVVGVDRGVGENALREAGAHVVVPDLGLLLPSDDASREEPA